MPENINFVEENIKVSRTLADWYFYWSVKSGRIQWSQWAMDAVLFVPEEERYLDPISVLSLLSFEYICLDRTLVQGISRLPWMGGVNENGEVIYYEAPSHGDKNLSPNTIAQNLWNLLREELRVAVRGKERIYILLSGGMDSRVVSAAIKDLSTNGEISVPIEAVTWGIGGTRDVIYAERLANSLGWQWTHIPLDAATYWANFKVAATYLGAECDPKHLHRMTWFEKAAPNSIVIAASYGDSIGRGEYSSVHLKKVKPLRPSDRFCVMNAGWFDISRPVLVNDILTLRTRHGTRSEMGFLELERQAHYMRRQLCHPMSIINRWAHLHQAFSSLPVFSFMWSLAPELRTDSVYQCILQKYAPYMLGVEWARTGRAFGTDGMASDQLQKSFHRYGYWLRTIHRESVRALLFDGQLEKLKVFNMKQLEFLYLEWIRERSADDTMLSTTLSMLATISIFSKQCNLQPPKNSPHLSVYRSLSHHVKKYASIGRQFCARVSRPYRH